MHSWWRRIVLVVVVPVAVILAVGAGTATAHGGPGHGLGRVSANALINEAAKQLDVTAAKLRTAIVDAAIARIDEAAKAGDIDADDVDEYKDEARENLRFAIDVSRTRVVASNLGITTAKLNTGFRAARKALILARIDEAVADGDLEADDAAELKADLEDAELPGYKAFGFHGYGYGHGRRG
jgi:hypothetical protein